MARLMTLVAAALTSLSLSCLIAADQPPKEPVDPAHAKLRAAGLDLFKKEVKQILVGRCVKCHGGEKTEGKFDLTTREGLLKGGETGVAIEIGKSKSSLLLKLIRQEEEPHMPADGAKLSDRHIDAIARWVDLGAPYDNSLKPESQDPKAWIHRTIEPEARDFWSFRPLQVVEPPAIHGAAEQWARTPIDRFIVAKLAEQGLTPNPIAERRVLIRRAYFDLIGLPPEPAEIEAFVNDPAPNAFEKVIDQLLASPHYGERWGRHWLDVARFAESHGFEQDYDRPHAYWYRDFVIQALNADMPFTQFVKWQLAGDEFAPQEPLAMMATGFLGAGVFPTQITANEVERTRYDALDDMTATTGTAFLGLTVGCARCHDHKFDPIPSADYYRMLSTFTTTVRSDIELNLEPRKYEREKSAFDAEHAPLVAALTEFEKQQLPKRFAEWEAAHAAEFLRAGLSSQWLILDVAEAKSSGGATLTKQPDGSVLATGKNPEFDTYTLTAHTNLAGLTALRLEALSHSSLVKNGPGRADNGNFDLTDIQVMIAPRSAAKSEARNPKPVQSAQPLKLLNPISTFDQGANLSVKLTIDGDPKSGWAIDPEFGKNHAARFEFEKPIGDEGGSTITVVLAFNGNNKHNLGRVRLSVTTSPEPVPLDADATFGEVIAALRKPAEQRSPAEVQTLLTWYRGRDDEWKKLNGVVQQHAAKEPKPNLVKVMVCSEGVKPIRHHTQGADFFNESYFLHRGDTGQKVAVAEQGFLQVLNRAPEREQRWIETPPAGATTSYRRRSLANWITDTEQGPGHLLARVIANRIWQHHFHVGIVSTPNDFGAMGQRPTHPELLDWLAATLMASPDGGKQTAEGRELSPGNGAGWRLKPLHKLIMLSAVYQQTSRFDAAKSKLDPQNQFHWRRSPRRLEAEVIRDAMLAASGELDRTQFGPGTLDDGHKRRSIYFMVKRSRLIPMMQLFDSPEPLVSVGERPSTTIAPQALLFMNNAHVRAWATSFGRRLAQLAEHTTEAAIHNGYLTAIGRPPTAAELADSAAFLKSQTESYRQAGQDRAQELAFTDFAQVLMSLNEFVYVD
jgi:mono/diheme cytochrome c family protein